MASPEGTRLSPSFPLRAAPLPALLALQASPLSAAQLALAQSSSSEEEEVTRRSAGAAATRRRLATPFSQVQPRSPSSSPPARRSGGRQAAVPSPARRDAGAQAASAVQDVGCQTEAGLRGSSAEWMPLMRQGAMPVPSAPPPPLPPLLRSPPRRSWSPSHVAVTPSAPPLPAFSFPLLPGRDAATALGAPELTALRDAAAVLALHARVMLQH